MKLSGSVKFKNTACKHDNYRFSKRIPVFDLSENEVRGY